MRELDSIKLPHRIFQLFTPYEIELGDLSHKEVNDLLIKFNSDFREKVRLDRQKNKKDDTSVRSILNKKMSYERHCPICRNRYAECTCELPYDELFPSEEDLQ